jgi:NitT/TauT family transport system ATP-binding protein
LERRPIVDIQFTQISKSYDQKTVLENLNATFIEGRINCLMGASGMGKTTMINMMMGLVKPDSGEVKGCQGKQIAAVFQEDRLIEHWNAVKNIRLVCDRTIPVLQIEQELQKVGLERDLDKPVKFFSGGMRRRVAVIRAMLAKSDLVILDEPFRGLDNAMKERVIEYIKQNTIGKTVIVVTHDRNDVQLLEGNLVTLTQKE